MRHTAVTRRNQRYIISVEVSRENRLIHRNVALLN